MKLAAVGALFAFALITGGWAQSPPAIPIPLDFFGIHMNEGPTGFTTPVLQPIIVGSGAKGAATNWPYVETARGTYTWKSLDAVAAFNKSTGKPVFEGYQEQPMWAVGSNKVGCVVISGGIYSCPAAPSDVSMVTPCQQPLAGITTKDCMLKEFTHSMANRYKSTGIQDGCAASNPQCHGVIEMYEGQNEPPYWPGPGGCPAASSCLPIASFVQIEADRLSTIKDVDPNVKVCSPAFEPAATPGGGSADIFIKTFLTNGGAEIPYDCWDFHANGNTPEAQIDNVNVFKGYLDQYVPGGSAKATIYATEAGRWGGCTNISDADAQAYVGRIELLYWSNNVRRHYWYGYSICAKLSNQPTSATLTPAGIAYGNVESWMVGSTMTAGCTLSGSFWSCPLTLGNGHQALAVWYNVFQSTATAPYLPASQYTEYRDLSGTTTPVSGSVTLGEAPILFGAGKSAGRDR
jgi:hypothetical protein